MNTTILRNLTLIAACLLFGLAPVDAQEKPSSKKDSTNQLEKDEALQWLVDEFDLFGDKASQSRVVDPMLPFQGWNEFQSFFGLEADAPRKAAKPKSKARRTARNQIIPSSEPIEPKATFGGERLERNVDDFMDRLLNPDEGSGSPWDFDKDPKSNMLSQVTGLIRGFAK